MVKKFGRFRKWLPLHPDALRLFNVPDVLVCKKCHIAILSIFFCFYVGKATMNKVKERETAWMSSYIVRPYVTSINKIRVRLSYVFYLRR